MTSYDDYYEDTNSLDLADGCPHCEQVKAHNFGVSERFYDHDFGQYVHALYSHREPGVIPLVPCSATCQHEWEAHPSQIEQRQIASWACKHCGLRISPEQYQAVQKA